MIKVIHDITNLKFRDPAGALRAGSSVSLTVLVSRGFRKRRPILHVRYDKDSFRQVIRMEPAGGSDLYEAWTTVFTPRQTGLYWYWFELSDRMDDVAADRGRDDDDEDRGRDEGAEERGWHEGTDNGWDEPAGYPQDEFDNMPSLIGCDPTTAQAVLTDNPCAWQITVFEPAYDDPDWIRGGVFYHIFVDRFAKSGEPVPMEGKILRDDWGGMPQWRPDERGEILNNDFFGGNLAGIKEKLPYLESLGVTCLYLSPIFEAYSSHKYDTSDYMKVDPMFGDEEGFTSLCEEADRRGIRVICDGVFSHTGSDSRYFDIRDRFGDGACHHPDSPYRDWYYFENGSWQSWWGIKTLPRINKNVPSYQEFMAGRNGVVRHWLRAGASGWRLDVVDELPRAFLEKLVAAAKAEKPDALMLGEVWEDASNKIAYEERKNYFEGDKLDSVMNYPLQYGIINYVRSGDAQLLARSMTTIMDHYPLQVVHTLMNILGTHDTERIITALAGQRLGPDATREEKASLHMDAAQWATGIRRLKTAVVLQMTLPGVPCIYYGDEAGMEGYADPFNRRCFPWGHENPVLQDWYRRVIAIRRSFDVYRDGGYRLLAARDGLFAFERAKAGGSAGSGNLGGSAGSATLGDSAGFVNPGDSAGPANPGGSAGPANPGDRLITVTNCGEVQHTLSLTGTWWDLLSGAVFDDDILILPGQAMILKPAAVF